MWTKLNGGNQMNEVMSHKSSIALRNIVQLNPFDAVAIVKKHKTKFIVEMVNAKATVLFNEHYESKMSAEQFFSMENWKVVKESFLHKGEIKTLNLGSKGNIEFVVQNLLVSGNNIIVSLCELYPKKQMRLLNMKIK